MATEEILSDKSRRERRKEARLTKNKKKFESWLQRQQSFKSNGSSGEKPQKVEKSENRDDFKDPEPAVNLKVEKKLKRKKCSNRSPKSNFIEFLRMEEQGKLLSAEEDMRLERRLAKKLKLKNGNLGSANDDIEIILEGIPSVLSNLGEREKTTRNAESGSSYFAGESDTSENEDDEGQVSADAEDGISADDEDEDGVSADDEDEDGVSADDEDEDEVSADDVDEDEVSADDEDEDEVSVDDEDEESDSLASSEDHDDTMEVIPMKNSHKEKRRKTNFEKYLESSLEYGKSSVDGDLALERKLAKKLKVKAGRLGGDDDEINMLLVGIPSLLDSEGEPMQNPGDRKIKHSKLTEHEQLAKTSVNPEIEASGPAETFSSEKALNTGAGKYVAPHLRSLNGNESAEYAQVRKRVRGLLNRLSETNVESIAGEISSLFHSIGRNMGSQIITEEIVTSCSGGPRGSEQYAAVFAAFVAGMSCLVGVDFGAKLLARLAKSFEEEYMKEDNLSLRNVTLLLSYLYVFGLCSSELIYDFLIMLGKRLTEVDVSTVLTVLHCCGMKLRGDDPLGMKNFVLSVQSRVNELKASSGNDQSNICSKRMEFMLETIFDIKNNKKRPKEETVQHTRIKKWLQKLRVDDILIRGLKWSKLIDPGKKGQWWLSGDLAATTENVEEVAGTIDKEIPETKKMLELAVSQRMNTDARRAIFCVIMSGEDYIDAFEKLLRLDLPGKQDREIMRVLVDCCLQEKVFNKYYCVLASKLCSHDKNHKFTLQYCLWDHFKELESMSLIRSMHLSKFTAEMIASFSLSLAVLKAVDLNDPIGLSPKRIMHFRMLFEAIFELSDRLIWNIFTRVAVTPEYEVLRSGILFFITTYVVSDRKSLAKKALNNIQGVLL